MWFVYILECADGSYYIGETNDVNDRVAKHVEGSASRFTATRRPVRLAYSERHHDRDSALRRERQLKGWTRVKKAALIGDDPRALKQA